MLFSSGSLFNGSPMASTTLLMAATYHARKVAEGESCATFCDEELYSDDPGMDCAADEDQAGTGGGGGPAAPAGGGDDESPLGGDYNKIMDSLMVAVKPHVGQLGIGAVMGYCSGKFLGNMGSMAAYYVGGAFCFLQVLNKSGYIDIKWDKVQGDVSKSVMLDVDGDGVVDEKDLKAGLDKVIMLLGDGVPGAASFGFFFLMGAGLIPFL